MEYQKKLNLLGNKPNQPTKFRAKKWFEINDESHGIYNTNSQIRFKISMLRPSLCDYSMHIYLLKELQQLRTLQQLKRQQIMLIKR